MQLGFQLFAKSPSDSVTALTVPTGLDGQEIRQMLEDNYHITIMGGQDQAKGKIIRIGHMGYIQDSEQLKLLESLGQILNALDPQMISHEQIQKVVTDARAWLEARPL